MKEQLFIKLTGIMNTRLHSEELSYFNFLNYFYLISNKTFPYYLDTGILCAVVNSFGQIYTYTTRK